MAYSAGTSIGRADSTDGGVTWTKWPAPILTNATSPGLAYDGATWVLAFVDPTGAIRCIAVLITSVARRALVSTT